MTHWEVLDDTTRALTLEYFFRPNSTARAFAVRFRDDELAILSPPVGVPREAYTELAQHGRVTALVAPNGLHWLGLKSALEAFPDAKLYAPDGAAKRIRKKDSTLALNPLAELSSNTTQGVRFLDVPGFSIGETWAVVDGAKGPIWYVGDSCLSMAKLPNALPVKLLIKWTKSGPGLCLNGLGNTFFLKDKPGYKHWFLERLEKPPETLVTAHGDVLHGSSNLGKTLSELVEQRL